MEKELVHGKLGTDGSYELKLDGTDLVVQGDYAMGVLGVGLQVKLGVKALLLLLKEKIPGKIDDVLIDIVLAELEKGSSLDPKSNPSAAV